MFFKQASSNKTFFHMRDFIIFQTFGNHKNRQLFLIPNMTLFLNMTLNIIRYSIDNNYFQSNE